MNYSPIIKIVLFIGFVYTYNSFNLNKTIKMNSRLYNSKKQCIISSKNKKSYCGDKEDLFINNNEIIDKRLITISPGGYKGFYLLGILTYIKENYNTNNIIFSGASAGAWNSLFMCYKGSDPLSFVYKFLDANIRKAKSITELQYFLKYKLLSCYKTEDFDLKKIFLGVTAFNYFLPVTNVYTDFEDLEDAINCCMASSHIPLITGGLTNRYKNLFSFDGGFSSYPYLDKERIIHISLSMWDELNTNNKQKFLKQNILNIKKFASFFSLSKNNLLELFDNGYNDAKLHKQYFDKLLESKIDEDTPEF